jgi:asparagine synthase (glutamine-hydrolysing)
MCGIAGLLRRDGEPASAAQVRAMTELLAHRGPNDVGTAELGPIVLGQRRLSILDLSSRGHQPMASPDGRFHIVHNGEIYNFLELRSELEGLGVRFTTETDTEVILAAHAVWGPTCVSRFNGIWAFALWDTEERRLLLSRDRFGVKPLFIARDSRHVAFASEIKALRTLPWVSDEPDPAAVREYLVDALVDHSDHTFYRDVQRVPAATNLVVEMDRDIRHRYWQPSALSDDSSPKPDARDSDRVDEIRSLLIDAVALELRSDVPLGSCLSGGLDSSGIVSIAAGLRNGRLMARGGTLREREATAQLAFHAEFADVGINERPFAEAVAAGSGVKLLAVSPSADDFLSELGRVQWHQDEPFASTSIFAQYAVMRLAAASGVTVMLDGQGADEMFGGYPPYASVRAADLLRSVRPAALRAARRQIRDGAGVSRALRFALLGDRAKPNWWPHTGLLAQSLGSEIRKAAPLRRSGDDMPGTLLSRLLWRQIRSESLPSLLRYEDRNSMAFAIEARVPFLDHRLVEAALALPDRLRIERGQRKVAVRQALEGLVPQSVLDRRDKVGFQPPQKRWLRESLPRLACLAQAPMAEACGLLATGSITKAMRSFEAGGLEDSQLWRILNLEAWLRTSSGKPVLAPVGNAVRGRAGRP